MNREKTEKKLAGRDYLHGIKIIWKEITVKHKKEIHGLVTISFFIAFLDGIVPLISGRFFDALTNISVSIVPVWTSLALLLSVTALATFGQRWKASRSDWVGIRIGVEYFTTVAAKLVRLPMSYLKNHPMPELEQKTVRAGNNLESMFQEVIIELLPAFLSIIVALVTVFTLNTTLALILLSGVVVYIIVIVQTVGDGARLQRENQKQWVHAWRERADGIYNIATIKQFAAEEFETNKNRVNFTEKVLGAQRKLWSLWTRINLSQKIIVLLTQALVLIVSIHFLSVAMMTPGEVIAFNAYVGMVFGPFLRLGNMWRTIQNSIINVTDAHEILSVVPESYDQEGAIQGMLDGKVEFKNVTFFHDERKNVLEDVSFTADPGSIVAFVGKTGSGKTSLTELIYRFHSQQSGQILIDNEPIESFDLTSLRSQIGIVPQEPVLFDTSIRKNIMFPKMTMSQEELDRVAQTADLLEFIKELPDGWETIVGDRGVKLSGGQKQRIAIARALIANPKILILDESTSALDAETQRTIENALKALMQGKTTFIVAHRLSAVRNADKIFILHKGKIVEEGNHEVLMQIPNGRYRRLYELQYNEDVIVTEEIKLENE